jgi:23S rRNA (cytosine1962-C5)-methyltransferase
MDLPPVEKDDEGVPAGRRIALRVTPAAERKMRQGHPWLFDQSITGQSHAGTAGDLGVVFDSDRRFLAIGLYDPTSPIRLRVLQHRQPTPINDAWLHDRMAAALSRREPLEVRGTNGYRMVHGENDGLPGLVIDRYAGTCVVKVYTVAWIRYLRMVVRALLNLFAAERVVLRFSRRVQDQPELLLGLADGQVVFGPPLTAPVLFLENGLTFESDPLRGQKTGFFLDQRDNRARVELLAEGKEMINVFAYTGGFGVYAARGGARSVLEVDASQPALAAAMRNFNYNKKVTSRTEHELLVGDAFRALDDLQRARRRFDLLVIDPPSFANSQDAIGAGLDAYRRLVNVGLPLLRRGGTLVMASCSSRIGSDLFYETVETAARDAGRPLSVFERTGHALDHPISFREGAYLKCLFATVS